MDATTIRQKFLEFFSERQHQIVRSSPLVPANDPTLYFTNAGMVQFKDVFTGAETRSYRRAASSQKCLRVSGKHNDLETVGRTPKHHTFFEMLGNFSFGDYFKHDAIKYAWDFLTNVAGLDGDRMVATVFRGDDDVDADEEAFEIWRDVIGLPSERIFRLGRSDNFWAMGETGPCGPCSEIHLLPDSSITIDEGLSAGGPEHDERWVEVWNLVFMQFDRQANGAYQALSQTGVDTGMGLERLTALVNGFASTYDTDLVRPIIEHIADASGKRYGSDPTSDISMRVIADHARSTAFCIAEGVFPEKGEREYVLRRIMRRAIRHGQLLEINDLFLSGACSAVVEAMGDAYPELAENAEVIVRVVDAEERAFRRTLDRGLKKLERVIRETKHAGNPALEVAFVGDLKATDGFPTDLTRLIAKEAGLEVDEAAAKQWVAETHGAEGSKVGDAAVAPVLKQLSRNVGPTRFCGYERSACETQITAIVRNDQSVDELCEGEMGSVIVACTPFYARSGGQVGDTGTIRTASSTFRVSDTVKPDGSMFVHLGDATSGTLRVGDHVQLHIDVDRRNRIRLNHSATHLLHHALRNILGKHVAQKGSEVNDEYLRFDFSHFDPLTNEQMIEVETQVNQQILLNSECSTDVMTFEEARNTGAMALFGEKYGDRVRVVRVGDKSIELCGGTHVARTGDIGTLRITSEELLALGVRRIVAVTGMAALRHDQDWDALLKRAARQLKIGPQGVPDRIEKLLAQNKSLERTVSDLKRRIASGTGTDPSHSAIDVDGVQLLAIPVEDADPKTLRDAADTLRDKLGTGVVVLGGSYEGKARLIVTVSRDLLKRVHAGKLVAQLAQIVDGKGGGRPDMAQAGGPTVSKLKQALAEAPTYLSQMLHS